VVLLRGGGQCRDLLRCLSLKFQQTMLEIVFVTLSASVTSKIPTTWDPMETVCIHELTTMYDMRGKSPSHEHGHGSAAWDVLHMHAHEATRLERMQATII